MSLNRLVFFFANFTNDIMRDDKHENAWGLKPVVSLHFFYISKGIMQMEKMQIMKKLRDNSSTILTCVGAIGVVATAVMAVKATPKAIKLLEEAREEKGEELTKLEKIDVAGPVYIPTILIGASTVACIFGANILNKRAQATLMSAYALLDNSYKEYVKKAEELYGEEADAQIKEELARENYEEGIVVPREEELFFDFKTLQYFHASMDEVVQKVTMDDGLECYIINAPFDHAPDIF